MAHPNTRKEWNAIIAAVKRRADRALLDASSDAAEMAEAVNLLKAMRGMTASGKQ